MNQATVKVYDFTLFLAGAHELTPELGDALYEAGCDDSSPCSRGRTVYVHFHREAESLEAAIRSAIGDVRKAGFEVAYVKIEVEDLESALNSVRSKNSMSYSFTLILAGVSDLTDELQGDLLRAGCDDGSLWSEGETVYLSFDRESESLGYAIGSAVKDVEKAGYTVARIEVDPREPRRRSSVS